MLTNYKEDPHSVPGAEAAKAEAKSEGSSEEVS